MIMSNLYLFGILDKMSLLIFVCKFKENENKKP